MNQTNPAPDKTKEIQIVAGLKVVETEYRVQSPVFEEVIVKVPKFIDEPVKVPSGIDDLIETLTEQISKKVLDKIELQIGGRLDKVIDQRIKEIKVPKIIEELTINTREVEIEKPVYREVEITKPIYKEVEIINPIMKNQEIINAVIVDQTVINAIIKDIPMTNAIIKDVEVERAVIREKVVDVIHPRYLDLKGNPV